MTRTLTCIICPRGCTLTAAIDGETVTVTGNGCPRGVQYATDECTHPVRTVTSTIRVANRHATMVSVKTAAPVAKDDIPAVMAQIRKAAVCAPVESGDILLRDVCGTAVIATKTIR